MSETLETPVPMGTDSAAQTDERAMSVRWLNDRQEWSKERFIDLGTGGNMFPTVTIHRLGIYRTRQWEFVLTSPVVQCLVAIEEEAEALT